MSNLVFGHDRTVIEWIEQKLGKPFGGAFSGVGVVDQEGRLVGGFVFTSFTGTAVEVSVYGRACASRRLWVGILQYVFGDLNCARLSISTRKDNKAVRKQAPRLGFKFEGVARRLFGEYDGYTFALIRDDIPAFIKRWKL